MVCSLCACVAPAGRGCTGDQPTEAPKGLSVEAGVGMRVISRQTNELTRLRQVEEKSKQRWCGDDSDETRMIPANGAAEGGVFVFVELFFFI